MDLIKLPTGFTEFKDEELNKVYVSNLLKYPERYKDYFKINIHNKKPNGKFYKLNKKKWIKLGSIFAKMIKLESIEFEFSKYFINFNLIIDGGISTMVNLNTLSFINSIFKWNNFSSFRWVIPEMINLQVLKFDRTRISCCNNINSDHSCLDKPFMNTMVIETLKYFDKNITTTNNKYITTKI